MHDKFGSVRAGHRGWNMEFLKRTTLKHALLQLDDALPWKGQHSLQDAASRPPPRPPPRLVERWRQNQTGTRTRGPSSTDTWSRT